METLRKKFSLITPKYIDLILEETKHFYFEETAKQFLSFSKETIRIIGWDAI